MIVNVTVSPTAPASGRVIAAALSVLTSGDRAKIAGQEVRREGRGNYLVNGRPAGPLRLAARCLEALTARQAAADALLADALQEAEALRAGFHARRLALPAGDVVETAALSDPAIRVLTPALLAAALADPACAVVGVPCLVEIAATMIHARIVGAESRPDPRLVGKYGPELYPGVLMLREAGGAEIWHKVSRRSVMIAASLAEQYDADRPVAARASKADMGLARLSAQAARAAADLQSAQRAAQQAAEALLRASRSASADLQ